MINLGTVRPGSTIYVPFHTFDSNDPSASVTITGLAVTDIEIYKDGSTTQRASDAGYTLLDTDGIDFDTVTGIHGFSVDLADNTTAGFWAAGSQYTVVVASITVDAATINFIPVVFEIGYPDALINTTIATLSTQTSFTLTDGPAEDDALNGMWCLIHDVASAVQLGKAVISDYTGSTKTVTLAAGTTFTVAATDNISIMGLAPLQPTTSGNTLDVTSTGAAGIDWGNVENPTTAVDLSGTDIQLCDTITTYTGNTVQTGDSFARLGAPAGASVSADIATVDSNVDAILVDTGTTLDAHLTDIKGTAFVKDTHSLTNIEGYADLIDDGTSGLAKIATDVAAVLVDTADMQPKLGTPAGASISADIAALNDISVADILTTQMTEAYAADGAAPTLTQALMMIQQMLGDFSISGTTLTVKQVDGTTTAATYTLDDGSNPTSITRAT